MSDKLYLGDGVYVDVERGMIKLTTSDGVRDTNTIYLEVEVWGALERYVRARLDARTADTSSATGAEKPQEK